MQSLAVSLVFFVLVLAGILPGMLLRRLVILKLQSDA
jgi:hypothetical protein